VGKQSRGFGIYFLISIFLVGLFMYLSTSLSTNTGYTYQQFVNDLNESRIGKAVIEQNKQVPTGQVHVALTGGEEGSFCVSDVAEIEQLLRDKHVAYVVEDVPKDSVMMNVLLPVMLSLAVVLVVMLFMNRSMGGGRLRKQC